MILDVLIRPSLALTEDAPLLSTTLPALLLAHRRVEAYAIQMHRGGLLYGPDLGERSFARNETRHPREALDARPELRDLYTHLRERPVDAWIFFGAPSGAAMRRALALYFLLWHRIVERSELIGSAQSRALAAEKAAEQRRALGPSFVFFPLAVDPLAPHASRQEAISQEARLRRLRLLAGTLAATSDVTHEELAPVLDLSRPRRKEATPGLENLARIGRGSLANLTRALEGDGRDGQRHYAVMTLHGRWSSLWNSAAVRIYQCPLSRDLFCSKSAQVATPEHGRGGTSRGAFVAAAVQLLAEAELFGAPERDTRRRLMKEARELGMPAGTSDLAAAVAGRLYDVALSALEGASDASALEGASDSTRLSSPESSEPWTPVAF